MPPSDRLEELAFSDRISFISGYSFFWLDFSNLHSLFLGPFPLSS